MSAARQFCVETFWTRRRGCSTTARRKGSAPHARSMRVASSPPTSLATTSSSPIEHWSEAPRSRMSSHPLLSEPLSPFDGERGDKVRERPGGCTHRSERCPFQFHRSVLPSGSGGRRLSTVTLASSSQLLPCCRRWVRLNVRIGF